MNNIINMFRFAILFALSTILVACGGEDPSDPVVSEPEAPSVEQPGTNEVPGETPEPVKQSLSLEEACGSFMDISGDWGILPDIERRFDPMQELTIQLSVLDGEFCLIEAVGTMYGWSVELSPDAQFPVQMGGAEALGTTTFYTEDGDLLVQRVRMDFEGNPYEEHIDRWKRM